MPIESAASARHPGHPFGEKPSSMKTIIVHALILLPCPLWPVAGRVLRAAWPRFGQA